jgi:hypothetical protein
MTIEFRRHDATAKNLTPTDQQAYRLRKSALQKAGASQDEADEALNAFFWQCFEDDEEDEGEATP